MDEERRKKKKKNLRGKGNQTKEIPTLKSVLFRRENSNPREILIFEHRVTLISRQI